MTLRHSRVRHLSWWIAAAFYVVILLLTAAGGVWWSLWAWTLVATPMWVRTTKEHRHARWLGLAVLFALMIVVPVAASTWEQLADDVPSSVAVPLTLVIVLTPLAAPVIARRVRTSQRIPDANRQDATTRHWN